MRIEMDRIDKILNHDLFFKNIQKNKAAEENRPFCRHDLTHFLDVARIGEIMNLEDGLGIEREWIYAAALLHDLGRHVQYADGTPHELASAEIAPAILRDCGFDDSETGVIIEAIRCHRNAEAACTVETSQLAQASTAEKLRSVLYRADKASRACFGCEAEKRCDWKKDKKNLKIRY